jgi:hypothetical protein
MALRRGRVIGTDGWQLPVLHVSSDNQQHEQGGAEDYPFIELHQFWHVRSVCRYLESSSEPRHPPGLFDVAQNTAVKRPCAFTTRPRRQGPPESGVGSNSVGSLIEGLKLGYLFKDMRIKTVVEGDRPKNLCASACALAFLGGHDSQGRPWGPRRAACWVTTSSTAVMVNNAGTSRPLSR